MNAFDHHFVTVYCDLVIGLIHCAVYVNCCKNSCLDPHLPSLIIALYLCGGVLHWFSNEALNSVVLMGKALVKG